MLIVAIAVAAKSYDDFYYKNSYYARVGGISNKEINYLELKFLQLLNFDVSVPNTEFQAYLERLQTFLDENHMNN